MQTELACCTSLFRLRASVVRPGEVARLFRFQPQRSYALTELVPSVQVVPLMRLERATFHRRRAGTDLCLGMAKVEDGA